MAAVTAALIKELRDRTGAGMGDCKKALDAVAGDIDKAIEKLRTDGSVKADKKAGRTAAEGIIAVAQNDSAIALVEVNSETDFVAKGEDFRGLAKAAAEAALAHRPADAAALGALKVGEQTLEDRRRELVGKIGENLTIRRVAIVEAAGGPLVVYIHPGDKIAVALSMKAGDVGLAKDLAMHAAAMAPRHVDAAAVPADVLATEKRIIEATVAKENEEAAAEGKPAKSPEIQAKQVEGKLRKFVSEITLLGQAFVKNEAYGMKSDDAIEKVLKAKGSSVAHFARFAVGEGIEKKQGDFASEVDALVKG